MALWDSGNLEIVMPTQRGTDEGTQGSVGNMPMAQPDLDLHVLVYGRGILLSLNEGIHGKSVREKSSWNSSACTGACPLKKRLLLPGLSVGPTWMSTRARVSHL
jgi:hypothetical protein